MRCEEGRGVRRAGLLVTIMAMLAWAPAARAETFTVSGTGDTASDAPCSLDTCPSIRAAITAAGNSVGPDTIVVRAGDYQLDHGELLVDNPVTITGAGARTTIVRGTASYRVVEV